MNNSTTIRIKAAGKVFERTITEEQMRASVAKARARARAQAKL